jgi:hypothetical protein
VGWKLEVAANRQATSWTDRTEIIDRTTLAIGGVAHRAEIDAGSGFDLADDAGTITLPARRVVRVIEDATTPDTTMFRGRIIGKELARGTRFTGDAKQFDTSLVDYNADFGGLPISRWRRPAETDHARMRALLEEFLQGTKRASTNLLDTYLQTTSPVNLPAYTYDAPAGGPAGVVAHILSEAEFKECFITEDGELFYGPRSSTVYAASLAITDVSPDGITTFPPIEPQGTEDGTEWLAGVKVVYRDRRFVYVIDNTVLDAHDVWYATIVDETIPNLAAAQRRGNSLLRDVKNENTSYRCSILLKNTQVDLIKRGQTVSFRSAAAGVLSPLVMRVGRLVWHWAGPEHWIANLELDFPRKLAGTIPPPVYRGNPGPFVPGDDVVPGDDPGQGTVYGRGDNLIEIYVNGTHIVDNPASATTPTTVAAGILVAGDNVLAARITNGHEPISWWGGNGTMAELRIFDHLNQLLAYSTASAKVLPISNNAGAINSQPANWHQASFDDSGWANAEDVTGSTDSVGNSFWTPDAVAPARRVAPPGAKGTNLFDEYVRDLIWLVRINFTGSETLVPARPVPGQTVTESATGDGSTTTRGTNYPYEPNSLEVFVGGIRVVPTETDPDAGTFTLPFAPATGTQILLRYRAADGTDLGAGNDPAPDSVTPAVPVNLSTRWEPVVFDNAGTPELTFFQDAAGVWDVVMHEVPV